MDIGLATSILAARQSATRSAISASVIKNQHQLELGMADMLAEAVKNVPPPGQGQGTRVDKTA